MELALEMEAGYTIADIFALPEGQRAELIDGRMYGMAAPDRLHQKLSGGLFTVVANHIRRRNGGCEIYAAPFAVFLFADDTTYVEPDLSVICDKSKLSDKGCCGAPDWVIEIVSPGSRRMDYLVKLLKYNQAGVREYWIADQEKDRITVYNFERKTVEEYHFRDRVKAGVCEGLEIDFSTLDLT